MTDTAPYTKVRFIQDKQNPDRKVTLGTHVENGELRFAVSVNNPPYTAFVPVGDGYYRKEERTGDRFSRHVGRDIVEGRIRAGRGSVTLPIDLNTQSPLVVALEYLAQNAEASVVRRIARDELVDLAKTNAPLLPKAQEALLRLTGQRRVA